MNQRLFPYYEHFEPIWNPLYGIHLCLIPSPQSFQPQGH